MSVSPTPEVEAEIDRLTDVAFKAAIAKVEALEEWLWTSDGSIVVDNDIDEDSPETVAPYCGCTTCQVREVLHAAWPHLRELASLLDREGLDAW